MFLMSLGSTPHVGPQCGVRAANKAEIDPTAALLLKAPLHVRGGRAVIVGLVDEEHVPVPRVEGAVVPAVPAPSRRNGGMQRRHV